MNSELKSKLKIINANKPKDTSIKPAKAIRNNCIECGGTAKYVTYCPSDGIHSRLCHLWQYRFGCRPSAVKNKALITPELMPKADTNLDNLPRNGDDYVPETL